MNDSTVAETHGPDDRAFQDVTLGSTEPNPCSPEPPEELSWRGVLINAPRRVVYPDLQQTEDDRAFARIPICGYFLIEGEAALQSPFEIVAVHQSSGDVFTGGLSDDDGGHPMPPPTPPPELTPEELEGLAVGGWFNQNLVDHVRLPELPAIYEVHVRCGPYRSNAVTIEVAQRDGE